MVSHVNSADSQGAWVMTRGGGDHAHGDAHPSAIENQYASGKQEDQHGRSGLETQFQEPDNMKNEGKAEGNSGGADNAENAPGVNPEKEASQQADVCLLFPAVATLLHKVYARC